MKRFTPLILMLLLLSLLGVAESQDVTFQPVIRGHDLVPVGVDHYVLEADSAGASLKSPVGQEREPDKFVFLWEALKPDGTVRFVDEDVIENPTLDEATGLWNAHSVVAPGIYKEGDMLRVTSDVLYAGANYAAMILTLPVYRQAPIIHGGEGMVARAIVTDEDPNETISCAFKWELQQPDDSWTVMREKNLVPAPPNAGNTAYESEDTYPAGLTVKRQNWRVRVIAWDGELESLPVTVAVTLRGRAPHIESVTVAPAP